MPRPKSDLKTIAIKLSKSDRDLLAYLAEHYDPPTRTEAVRQLVRRAALAKMAATKKSKKIPR